MEFDGNVVDMESCDKCDTRLWSMAGEPVDLDARTRRAGGQRGGKIRFAGDVEIGEA